MKKKGKIITLIALLMIFIVPLNTVEGEVSGHTSNNFYCPSGQHLLRTFTLGGDNLGWTVCCPKEAYKAANEVPLNGAIECLVDVNKYEDKKSEIDKQGFKYYNTYWNDYRYIAKAAKCPYGYRYYTPGTGYNSCFCNSAQNRYAYYELDKCRDKHGEDGCNNTEHNACYVGFSKGYYTVGTGNNKVCKYLSKEPNGYGTNSSSYTFVGTKDKCPSATVNEKEDKDDKEVPVISTDSIGELNCKVNLLFSGCKGDYVRNLQNKLNKVQKCNLSEDGSFGPATKNCVIAFQTYLKNNPDKCKVYTENECRAFTIDGVVGSKTLNELNAFFDNEDGKMTVTSVTYSQVTYNLDGGKFPNGDTERTEIKHSGQVFVGPMLIPGKDGYKFLGWYIDNEKYTFGSNITSDITLTAKWEKTDLINPCDQGDVYDYNTFKCYKLQKFSDTTKTKNDGKTIWTKWSYTNIGLISDGIIDLTNATRTAEGSDNSLQCNIAEGYDRDNHWKTVDTCREGSNNGGNPAPSNCYKEIKGSCFISYDRSPIMEDSSDTITVDDSVVDSKSSSVSVINNPKTGSMLIFVAWLIGFGALGYVIYYFRKRRNNVVE